MPLNQYLGEDLLHYLNTYVRKEERSQINDLSFECKKLKKDEIQFIVSKRKKTAHESTNQLSRKFKTGRKINRNKILFVKKTKKDKLTPS